MRVLFKLAELKIENAPFFLLRPAPSLRHAAAAAVPKKTTTDVAAFINESLPFYCRVQVYRFFRFFYGCFHL